MVCVFGVTCVVIGVFLRHGGESGVEDRLVQHFREALYRLT